MILFRKAVLIIHGFAGGTYDEERLANYLERRMGLDVFTFTLPGHEKRSFKTVKYTEWINASEKMINTIIDYGYKDIYVVGHSMGGVIASYLASKYSCIKKVVLAAPAFSYMATTDKAVDKIKGSIQALKKNDTDEVLTRFLKLPVTSMNEFKLLIKKYKNSYLNIKVPVLMIQGNRDTIVPMQSTVNVYNNLDIVNKKLVIIKGGTHDIFRGDSNEPIIEVDKFL